MHNQPSCSKILSAISHHGFPSNNLSKSIMNTSAQKLLLQFKTLNHTKKMSLQKWYLKQSFCNVKSFRGTCCPPFVSTRLISSWNNVEKTAQLHCISQKMFLTGVDSEIKGLPDYVMHYIIKYMFLKSQPPNQMYYLVNHVKVT